VLTSASRAAPMRNSDGGELPSQGE
jgi:hypothetical protein